MFPALSAAVHRTHATGGTLPAARFRVHLYRPRCIVARTAGDYTAVNVLCGLLPTDRVRYLASSKEPRASLLIDVTPQKKQEGIPSSQTGAAVAFRTNLVPHYFTARITAACPRHDHVASSLWIGTICHPSYSGQPRPEKNPKKFLPILSAPSDLTME